MNGSTKCREERLLTQHQYQKEKIANEFADIDKRDQQTSINIRMRKMYVTQTLLMKSENFMLMSLEVQSTFTLVVTMQLWYKHSVITAEKLRHSNPTAGIYLLTKTSVDGIEWICQSCSKHLKKDKIPTLCS